jgi:tetratricopeptide (TPR) repeat protein
VIAEWAERALALLDLGLGRLEEAARRLERLEDSVVERGYFDRAASLVETYCRLGRLDDARTAFERWLAFGPRTSEVDAAASAARCRGLLAGEDEFEAHFREALELQPTIEDLFGVGRTRLCLGERLRRAGRRIDARLELRGALEVFEELRAEPWAERARTEPRANGESLRRRDARGGEDLTPQSSRSRSRSPRAKRTRKSARRSSSATRRSTSTCGASTASSTSTRGPS